MSPMSPACNFTHRYVQEVAEIALTFQPYAFEHLLISLYNLYKPLTIIIDLSQSLLSHILLSSFVPVD